MAAGDEDQIVIKGRPTNAAELVAMADQPWTPPETESQAAERRAATRAKTQAKIDAEIARIAELGGRDLEAEMIGSRAQNAAWGELEETWAIISCLRNRAPYN